MAANKSKGQGQVTQEHLPPRSDGNGRAARLEKWFTEAQNTERQYTGALAHGAEQRARADEKAGLAEAPRTAPRRLALAAEPQRLALGSPTIAIRLYRISPAAVSAARLATSPLPPSSLTEGRVSTEWSV